MPGFKDRGQRFWMQGSKGQIHFESKFSSFCNLFLLLSFPLSAVAIQLKLRLNWQGAFKVLGSRVILGSPGWHLPGPVPGRGSAAGPDSQDPLAQALPWVSPREAKLKCEKPLAAEGIPRPPWHLLFFFSLCDMFLRERFSFVFFLFFHVSSFSPFRLFNNMWKQSCQGGDMLERQSKGVF